MGRFWCAVCTFALLALAQSAAAQEGAGGVLAPGGAPATRSAPGGLGGAAAIPGGVAPSGTAGRPVITSPGAMPGMPGAPGAPGAVPGKPGASPPAANGTQPPTPVPMAQPEQRNEFQDFVAVSVGRVLPLFGYDLFKEPPTTFAPVDGIPVTRDYVIGPGDEIVIRAWGQVDIDYRAVVDRNGMIHIPQVGALTVGGLRYQDLHGYLRSAIGRVFRNFELSVNLGMLRSIPVFVVGQAQRPGAYTISSLSTLVNALFASGGPSLKGSMRRIQLKRGENVVTEFDVYELLLKGDKTKDVRLLPGDVIYIPPIGDLVAVSGSVNQQAIYELKPGNSLADVLQFAGGLSTVAAGQKATIERIAQRRARQVEEVPLDEKGLATALANGDLVHIYPVSPRFENAITLRGAVAQPGRFPWREGMRVRDVIPDQEALIVADYWQRQNQAARVQPLVPAQASGETMAERRLASEGEQRFRTEVRRLYEEINWDYAVIERLNPADLTVMLLPFNLGRAVIQGDPTHNLQLRPGDVISVFSKVDIQVPIAKQTQYIRLEGEVAAPGVYQIMPGETLRQVVTRVGGFTRNAYPYAAELTRESVRIQQQKRLDEATTRLSQDIERTAAGRAQAGADPADAIAAQADSQRRLVERLREIRATGRVVMEMKPDRAELRDLPEIPLEDGDRYVVPHRPQTVGVIGAVNNQTTLLHDGGKRVSDYLEQAGGFTRTADKGYTYVVRADGSVTGHAASSGFLGSFTSERLHPGDTIVVPENLERFFWTRAIRDWTQIFSQLALGVAALKVLRDF